MDATQLFLARSVFAIRRKLAIYRLPLLLMTGATLLFAAALTYHMLSNSALQAARVEAAWLSREGLSVALARAGAGARKPDLKAFRSSHLLAILEQGASAANVKLDEITFVVDDAPNLPYVRYRATFQVVSRYPIIRKFISEILAGSEGVVLDTVACRREDITVADVRCDISAYVAYQEKNGG